MEALHVDILRWLASLNMHQLDHVFNRPGQTQVHSLAFECQNSKRAFVHAAQRLVLDELLQGFDAECKVERSSAEHTSVAMGLDLPPSEDAMDKRGIVRFGACLIGP